MEVDATPLNVTVHGPDDPELAIVGGVHGDETGGVRAVRRLREADLDLRRGIVLVLANPGAIDVNERYLDSDLNRVFPGDPAGDREERLAAELCDLIGDLTTLALHETHSRPTPFALIHRSRPREFDLAAELPVPYVVDHWGVNETTITQCGCTVEIEVGPVGTEAAAIAAEQQARAFLRRVDALPGASADANPAFIHMAEPIPKPDGTTYEVHVGNFEFVPEGKVYASVDGTDQVADEQFYPILMSAYGYPDIFGFKGFALGPTLEAATETVFGDSTGEADR